MKKFCAVILMAMTAGSIRLSAQLVDEYNPPRANCCLVMSARNLADQLQDWNQLGRYHKSNQELLGQNVPENRVVFMGDSITDLWKLDQYFPGKPYVNRGIGGQTTPQMLVRMYPDVIDLKPPVMVLLAGTNDIAHNTGPETAEMIEENIMAMTELAEQHGIKVILCSITPISDYPYLKQQSEFAKNPPLPPSVPPPFGGPMLRMKMTEGRPPADILKLNAWLKSYAAQAHATYVDYFAALVDEKGLLKDGVSNDGLHPNPDGYKVMAPIVDAAIQQALK
jgi:lysophospholipase L1-like esterase